MHNEDASAFAIYQKISKVESLPLLHPSAGNLPAKATGGIWTLCGGKDNIEGARVG